MKIQTVISSVRLHFDVQMLRVDVFWCELVLHQLAADLVLKLNSVLDNNQKHCMDWHFILCVARYCASLSFSPTHRITMTQTNETNIEYHPITVIGSVPVSYVQTANIVHLCFLFFSLFCFLHFFFAVDLLLFCSRRAGKCLASALHFMTMTELMQVIVMPFFFQILLTIPIEFSTEIDITELLYLLTMFYSLAQIKVSCVKMWNCRPFVWRSLQMGKRQIIYIFNWATDVRIVWRVEIVLKREMQRMSSLIAKDIVCCWCCLLLPNWKCYAIIIRHLRHRNDVRPVNVLKQHSKWPIERTNKSFT